MYFIMNFNIQAVLIVSPHSSEQIPVNSHTCGAVSYGFLLIPETKLQLTHDRNMLVEGC